MKRKKNVQMWFDKKKKKYYFSYGKKRFVWNESFFVKSLARIIEESIISMSKLK